MTSPLLLKKLAQRSMSKKKGMGSNDPMLFYFFNGDFVCLEC